MIDPVELLEELGRGGAGAAGDRGRGPLRDGRVQLLGVGGVPCVVLGPGSIDQAHTDDEWVPVGEVRQGAAIYAEMARRFARHHAEGRWAR